MKKIPTLFEREFFDDHTALAKPIVTPGMEWVLAGEGIATIKYDGACCAIIVCNASGDNTGCGANCGYGHFTKQEAIEAWNRRADNGKEDI